MYTYGIKIFLFGFIFLFLSFLNHPALAFVSTEGGFSVWMPTEPILQRIIHKSFAGEIKENTYIAKTDSEEFIVSYSELPKIALSTQSAKALLIKAKEGFIKDTHAQELSFEKLNLDGKQGRELSFRIITKNNMIDAVGKARFYLVNKTIYVIAATEMNYDNENKIIHQFLNSFKLF